MSLPIESTYDQGDVVRVDVAFSRGGVAVDPSGGVYFALLPPGGVEVVYKYGVDPAIVRDGAGAYHLLVDTSPSGGFWKGRWYSTGVGQAAVPWECYVTPTNVPMLTP